MPRPLSPEQREARAGFVRDALGRGMSWMEIAAALDMKATTLHQWWVRGGKDAQPTRSVSTARLDRAFATPGVTKRECLRCHEPFPSHGPGNRSCARCVSNAASMSPYAPDPGGDSGRRMAPAKGHQ